MDAADYWMMWSKAVYYTAVIVGCLAIFGGIILDAYDEYQAESMRRIRRLDGGKR